MIRTVICNVKDLDLERAINHVSQNRQEKIKKYRFLKDKKLSCGAELILNKMLSEYDFIHPIYDEDFYKKPYVKNYDVEFNLSHSKDMVACAVSDKSVGIDIEYVDKDIDLNIAKNYFFNDEYESIMQSSNRSKEFFKYWVLKESFMKYTSLGFNINLDEFNIKLNNEHISVLLKNEKKTVRQIKMNKDRNINLNNVQFKLFEYDDYMLAISSQEEVKNFQIIDVEELYI